MGLKAYWFEKIVQKPPEELYVAHQANLQIMASSSSAVAVAMMISVLLHSPVAAGVLIVLTRHGEKCAGGCTAKSSGNDLSPDGYARASYLAKCFDASSAAFPNGPPDAIVGTSASNRERELAAPLAKKLNIKMIMNCLDTTPLGYGCAKKHIEDAAKNGAKSVWVVWEHKNIPPLARYLGAHSAPSKWPDNCCCTDVDKDKSRNSPGCYDQIWQFQFQTGSGFKVLHQGFQPQGACRIGSNSMNVTEVVAV